jgi:hypothetical protein
VTSVDTTLPTLTMRFRAPLQFAAGGLVVSALNDGISVGISHFNGLQGKLFALNGIHNQYLVWLHAIVAYIVFPSLWAFFAWTNQAARRTLCDLRQDGVFADAIGCVAEDEAIYGGLSRRVWYLVCAVGTLLVLAGAYSLWLNPPAHEPGIVYYPGVPRVAVPLWSGRAAPTG